jgi:hypothetical protein
MGTRTIFSIVPILFPSTKPWSCSRSGYRLYRHAHNRHPLKSSRANAPSVTIEETMAMSWAHDELISHHPVHKVAAGTPDSREAMCDLCVPSARKGKRKRVVKCGEQQPDKALFFQWKPHRQQPVSPLGQARRAQAGSPVIDLVS